MVTSLKQNNIKYLEEKQMAKINLDNLQSKTFSVKADKEYENGAIIGLGDLVENEVNLYEAAEHVAGETMYLVTTPEIDRTSNSSSIDKTNKADEIMRVHMLESGGIFTIEKAVADNNTSAADQLVKIEDTVIGADARPAVAFRVK